MSESSGAALLLGGVGLFLLGMMLMTDGLKLAAGPALGRVLASSTQTRLRGLLSGILVTALVQSSSAVTVAAIGFVNAGLLSFSQSLWVLFGANVGTTMTGWLVALIGLKIKVEAAALPMIGLGMALRLSGAHGRRGAMGDVLAGFGVLFLGIALMQQALAGVGDRFDLAALNGLGVLSTVAFVAAGLLLTVLMQSSSAALAVVLTLAQSGVLPLAEAAAAVIGANVGTTITAVLAALGATPNAKRAAAAHVLFNLITGAAALVSLPLLLYGVDGLRAAFALEASPALSLALFHTIFNLLGVLLMWPLSARMAAYLERRFGPRDELVHPRHLDRNVASIPALAVRAIDLELRRLGGFATSELRAAIHGLNGVAVEAAHPRAATATLVRAITEFITGLSRSSMSGASASTLAGQLRVLHYYENCAELGLEIAAGGTLASSVDEANTKSLLELGRLADRLLHLLDPAGDDFEPAQAELRAALEATYQQLKAGLLASGAQGSLGMDAMDGLLRAASALRRACEQAAKAAALLGRAPPQGAADT